MMIGSAEYAILHLRTKLVVVAGHTKCGAVNAALQTVQQYAKERGLDHLTPQDIDSMIASLEGSSGSIGNVLQNIVRNAAEAIRQLPDGTMKEQAELAIEINVFSTIEKLIQNSEVLRKGVASGDLMVHGTVYNISSGAVKWLGPHPRLQEIVQAEMPMHVWNITPYVRSEAAAPGAEVENIITRLKEGNERFMNGETLSRPQTPAMTPVPLPTVPPPSLGTLQQSGRSNGDRDNSVPMEVENVTKLEDASTHPPGRGSLGGKLGQMKLTSSASLETLPQFSRARPAGPNGTGTGTGTIGRRVRSTTLMNLLADTPPDSSAIDPFAIILAGAEKNTAVEKIFDVLRTAPPSSVAASPVSMLLPVSPARPAARLRLRALLATLTPRLPLSLRVPLSLRLPLSLRSPLSLRLPLSLNSPLSLRLPLSLRSPVSECAPSWCCQRASSSCSAAWASSRAAGTVHCSTR